MKQKILLDISYHINKTLDTFGLLECDKIDIIYLAEKIFLDLNNFVNKDPASNNNYKMILESYQGFKTVMNYRIANYIYKNLEDNFFKIKARQISEYTKSITGIEIHPNASIGDSFILDHGYGTVIGETTTIGNSCYILQGVILGSKTISNNISEKRHPTIGNNIEIGAFCRLFGDITIGDNVFISPHNIITKDIPSNTKVIIRNSYE
jgi:serine O-acetyltransferase